MSRDVPVHPQVRVRKRNETASSPRWRRRAALRGTRRAKVPGGLGRPTPGLIIERPELRSVSTRLLEVVADDLLVLAYVVARRPRQPFAKCACSSARASLGIAEYAASRISRWRKRKASSPAKSDRSGRTSSLRDSARRWSGTVSRRSGWRELGDRAAMEDLALDGAALDHCALGRRQAVESRGEQRLDRRRDGDLSEVGHGDPALAAPLEIAAVDEHADHLLDEQRVALCGRADLARPGRALSSTWPSRLTISSRLSSSLSGSSVIVVA